MAEKGSVFLLNKYFKQGWLDRRYFDGKKYHQPYSADDRLYAGKLFYADFLVWQKGGRLVRDYEAIKVDTSLSLSGGISFSAAGERFRRALRCVSKLSLSVLYQIVLYEKEIKAPLGFSEREKLYFNDEIKGLLCRGLDDLCAFYHR